MVFTFTTDYSSICAVIFDIQSFLSEGLAVGVGFGAVGKTKAATFETAR